MARTDRLESGNWERSEPQNTGIGTRRIKLSADYGNAGIFKHTQRNAGLSFELNCFGPSPGNAIIILKARLHGRLVMIKVGLAPIGKFYS